MEKQWLSKVISKEYIYKKENNSEENTKRMNKDNHTREFFFNYATTIPPPNLKL